MTGSVHRAWQALDRHWFAPASLADLAIVRITLVASQLVLFMPSLGRSHQLAGYPDGEFLPIPALKVLMLPFGGWGVRPSADFLTWAWILAVVCGVLAVVGLGTRIVMPLFAATNTLLVAHAYSYRDFHHPEALMIIALWALSVAPVGRAVSLDGLLSRRRAVRAGVAPEPSPGLSPEARWPLRLIQWNFVLVYLSAGVSKLAGGGLEWMNGYAMSYYMLQDGIRWDIPLALGLQEHILLTAAMSVVAIAFEMTFAAAVLWPRVAWMYVLVGAALHLGIYVMLKAPFFQYIFLYVVFLESLRQHGPHLALARLVRPERARSARTTGA